MERERLVQNRSPDMQYEGFISSQAGRIRAIRSARGHGFSLEHEPSEGLFHVEIRYSSVAEMKLNKADKTDLKAALKDAFDDSFEHRPS